MNCVITAVKKMRSQILQLSSEDFELTNKLFYIVDVPYYDAPLEAETRTFRMLFHEIPLILVFPTRNSRR